MKQLLLKEDLHNKIIKTDKERRPNFGGRFLVVQMVGLIYVSLIMSCGQDKSILNQPVYEGPLITMDSIETLYSDEGIVKIVIKAPKELSFDGGNKEWPQGIFLEIYDPDTRKITTTFKSDRAYYYHDEDYYVGEGDVVVLNLETGDELTTEQLFWKPKEDQFSTEKFVTIKESDGEIHTGTGLIASQDFATYEITNPKGSLNSQ